MQYCARYGKDERCASVFSSTQDVVIERGCTSSLPAEQKQTCDSNSTNCIKCGYNKCNKDVSKLKTHLCIECSSSNDRDCVNENANFEARCSTSQCFTRLVTSTLGKQLERGCLADLSTSQCVAPDCVSCNGKNCNNQIFPEDRISCKSCKGDECKVGAVDKICNPYVTNDSCITVFGEDENEVLLRDCYNDAVIGTQEFCDDPSNIKCTKCQGNLCNTDNQRRGNKCFKCEGLECSNDPSNLVDCLSECFIGVNAMGAPKKDCASAVSNANLCGTSDLTCLTCNEDYCNGITFPTQDRLSCIKCIGEDCVNLITRSEYCERWSSSEKCVSVFSAAGIVVERGCSSTIYNSEICSSSNPNCLICNFDNCNVANSLSETFQCVSCKSEEDPNCVSNPNATQAIACTTDQCLTQLLPLPQNGIGRHIYRGCSSTNECSDCSLCKGERCNSMPYPTDRQSCYYCSGDNCAMGHLQEKLCTIYSQDKDCVTVYGTGEIFEI